MDFKRFKRIDFIEAVAYDKNAMSKEFLENVSISREDRTNGSPKTGDIIARNPDNHNDMWLISKDFFEKNYTEKQSFLVECLEEEAEELYERVDNLDNFIGSEKYKELSHYQQTLLLNQYQAMFNYYRLLTFRLQDLGYYD